MDESSIDELIHELQQESKILSIKDLGKICEKLKEILIDESNVQIVSAPVTICGNIHGQFSDLLEIFRQTGEIPFNNYVFLGGYVNNGPDSVQVIQLLLCLKLKYPGHLTLLRGKHETRLMSQAWGFFSEIERKYGCPDAWKIFMDIFDFFPIAALVEGKIFCVSSGLSPELNTLDQIRVIDRKTEIPNEGAFYDLVWSSPEPGIQGWKISPGRGIEWIFGQDIANKFNFINNLELIVRSHTLVMSGYEYPFKKDNSLVTVWSASNYKTRCGNLAAALDFNEDLDLNITTFK